MNNETAYDLVFPHLGISIAHLPRSLNLWGFSLYFYGIIIATGLALGVWLATRMMKRDGENPAVLLDAAFWLVLAGLIGARLYYVIFSWENYAGNPLSILNIREGGLAIFGGVLAGILALIIYTRRRQISFFYIGDYAAFALLTGQLLGRWGNFFNTEAFGGYTNGPFAMQIRRTLVSPGMISPDLEAAMTANPVIHAGVEYIQVHPTFLYESSWNLALLIFIIWFSRKRRPVGTLSCCYFIGEGIGRFCIESLRTDQLLFPVLGFPVSQGVALAFLVFGIGYLYYIYNRSTTPS
jgi:phosphatidylglycerol:prolipoprotein diacylglycerol transferase